MVASGNKGGLSNLGSSVVAELLSQYESGSSISVWLSVKMGNEQTTLSWAKTQWFKGEHTKPPKEMLELPKLLSADHIYSNTGEAGIKDERDQLLKPRKAAMLT